VQVDEEQGGERTHIKLNIVRREAKFVCAVDLLERLETVLVSTSENIYIASYRAGVLTEHCGDERNRN
jgi:hypothetical protein